MNQDLDLLFPAHISRASYFIRSVLLFLGGLVAGGTISLSEHAPLAAKIVLVAGGASLFLLLLFALFRSILIPRLRDMGLHPAWSLLILVHALNSLFLLALLVIPANAFARRPRADFW